MNHFGRKPSAKPPLPRRFAALSRAANQQSGDAQLVDSRRAPFATRFAIIADVAVVISIVVGILTYLDQKQDSEELRRRETALQLASLRHQSPYADISARLTSALMKNNRIGLMKGGGQITDAEAASSAIIAEVGAGDIDSLARFYSTIIECRDERQDKARMCDEKLIDSLVGPDIRFFYCGTRRGILTEIEKMIFSKNRYDKIVKYNYNIKSSCFDVLM